jgi:SEC-C motif-containing protein
MTKSLKRSSPCPCRSGAAYGDCCQPLHRAEREAESAVALMRSRFSAFAVGAVDHLVRTIHPEHVDAQVPEATLRSTLLAASRAYKYTGLTIEDHVEHGDRAEVQFVAKVFQSGVDCSFRERSRFVRHEGAWRYLDGETLPV